MSKSDQNQEKELYPQDQIVRLETNLDDCTGENLGYAMDCLLAAGARDVFYIPVFTKKNRPAYLLTVLCREEDRQRMEEIIFRETTSIGIRRENLKRSILPRETLSLKTDYGPMPVKKCSIFSASGRTEERIYPEYEGIRQLCAQKGLSYRKALLALEAAIAKASDCPGNCDC